MADKPKRSLMSISMRRKPQPQRATVQTLTSSALNFEILNADKCNGKSLVKPVTNSDARGDMARGACLLAPSQEGGCFSEANFHAQVDTRRMVETPKSGSVRSTGSAVAATSGDAPNPSPDITEMMNG